MGLDCINEYNFADRVLPISRPINREITEIMDQPRPGTSFLEVRAICDHRLYVSWRTQASKVGHHPRIQLLRVDPRRPAIDSSPSGITDLLEYRGFPAFRHVSPAHTLVPRERMNATFSSVP